MKLIIPILIFSMICLNTACDSDPKSPVPPPSKQKSPEKDGGDNNSKDGGGSKPTGTQSSTSANSWEGTCVESVKVKICISKFSCHKIGKRFDATLNIERKPGSVDKVRKFDQFLIFSKIKFLLHKFSLASSFPRRISITSVSAW